MRVVAITKIFPNRLEPLSSPFNRQQFAELGKLVDLKVVEAIPYVPLAGVTGVPARAKKLSSLPARDTIVGLDTRYMRQLYAPKLLSLNLPLYAASLAPYVPLARDADVLLGTWAYPDGCAAVLLGALVRRPVVVKVHGSDLNVVAKRSGARPFMRALLPRADALVSVATTLSQELIGLGVDAARIRLVPNGVDASLFRVRDQAASRKKMGVGNFLFTLYCGRLEEAKGTRELLAAFERILRERADAGLVLLGDGPLRKNAEALRARFPERVVVPGPVPLEVVAEWHGAADLFTLPSYSEGTPNVVLEALASGRPVVATNVGGIPDVVHEGENGFLVPPRDEDSLYRALVRGLDTTWSAARVAKTGPISWTESARKLYDVLSDVRGRNARSSPRERP